MDGLDPKFTINSENIEELLNKAKLNANNIKVDDSKLYSINVELNKYLSFAKNDPANQRLAENFNFQNKNSLGPLRSLSGEQKLVRRQENTESDLKDLQSKNKVSAPTKFERYSSIKKAPSSSEGPRLNSEIKANNGNFRVLLIFDFNLIKN